ncbi:low molecular weight phosphatase family protein [Corynebacterium sp. 153RC1]|uniref:arsenate-mycothiol transferase ArsC n=1 Tax=unclassified Corynebacterium TaxID=2624378 RepID=UPI00211BE09E|nr:MULTISPECIES: low molecular weight phosphatase family protein [unclassified Corynebacterium]MCQ9352834.1 low molecular weight phosphatase family protein [Corynebacterium sp. 209RC1]MCQ9355226.1 low molecular weight phosphatase family protein [Corynebacterium sp. 1222RC1]MCQ9357413.1 low molecular weight phosphatase family protein [Corynebacterium sp. 122RC1]MCQ9359659.1 low molecular weight phosphatase family protein [Corynebacterium sp. 142RC1]MCQ9361673.1 low molecular weight phosphatase 
MNHTPSVLFVCVKNAGKSQMAAALARMEVAKLEAAGGPHTEIYSAGTTPGKALNEDSRNAVEKLGATFAGEHPKAIDPGLLLNADRVILIGPEAQLEPVEGMRATIERWLPDEPSLRGIEGSERMELLSADLHERVKALLRELHHS